MPGTRLTPIAVHLIQHLAVAETGLEARHLDEAVEHIALRLGDPAKRIRVDA